MPSPEGNQPSKEVRRAKKGPKSATPVTLTTAARPSATDRLDAMTRERIDALEEDKKRLQAECNELRKRVDCLAPQHSRLSEALANAESNNVVATILIGLGGFLVSFATFTGKSAERWASVAAGCLLAGIGLMLWQSFRRWRRGH